MNYHPLMVCGTYYLQVYCTINLIIIIIAFSFSVFHFENFVLHFALLKILFVLSKYNIYEWITFPLLILAPCKATRRHIICLISGLPTAASRFFFSESNISNAPGRRLKSAHARHFALIIDFYLYTDVYVWQSNSRIAIFCWQRCTGMT